MSYRKSIVCDQCGRTEEITDLDSLGHDWRPLSPGWRRLSYTALMRRDVVDDETHDFCSAKCLKEWAAERELAEEGAS